MLRYSLLRAKLLNEPILGGLGVGHCLLSRERLGRHDEERLGSLDFAERLGEVGGIHVGDEEELHIALRVRRKRKVGHDGAKIAAADSDIDHILDALAGEALPLAAPDGVGEVPHRGKHLADTRHDVLSVHLDLGLRIHVPESRMENCAALGGVDLLAREHLLDLGLEIGLLGKLDESLHHIRINAVLGIVKKPSCGLERKPLGAPRVLREVILDRLVLVLVDEFVDSLPCC